MAMDGDVLAERARAEQAEQRVTALRSLVADLATQCDEDAGRADAAEASRDNIEWDPGAALRGCARDLRALLAGDAAPMEPQATTDP